MTTIKEVMTKSPTLISRQSKLSEALALMQQMNFRHLPVVDVKGNVVGIVSQRDIGLGMMLQHQSVSLVEDVMVPDPYVVTSDTNLSDAVAEMRQAKFDAAVVVDDIGQVCGIFTITDALSVLADLTKKMA